MTISTTTSTVTYNGNASTTLFTFPFVGVNASDIEVIYEDVAGNLVTLNPSLYTLVINPVPVGGLWGIGGSVTYPTSGPAIQVGTYLTINRIVPYIQTVSISNQGAFYPQAVEQGLDLLDLQIQQLVSEFARTVQVPLGSPLTPLQYLESIIASVQLGTTTSFFATTSLLVALGSATTVSANTLVQTGGRTAVGDGGDSLFYYNSSDTTTADNGGSIRVDVAGRRWYAILQEGTPGFSVRLWGATGNGSTNDAAAILSALTVQVNKVTYIPDGTYLITGGIVLPSNTTVVGSSPETAILKSTAAEYMLRGTTKNNIDISNIGFTGPDGNTIGIVCNGLSTNWKIYDCITNNAALYHSDTTGANYAAASALNSPSNVEIHDCNGFGNQSSVVGLGFITMNYGGPYRIYNNYCNYYHDGIMWWGGDANSAVNGAVGNTRKVYDVTISDCIVENINQGGIWGSMGRAVKVMDCVAQVCGDVCFDCEGGQEVSFIGGKAVDGVNGGITTFWYNRNVLFENMDVTSSSNSFLVASIHNPDGNTNNNESISFVGGTWTCTSGFGTTSFDPVRYLKIDNVQMRNIILNVNSISWNQIVTNNILVFTSALSSGGVGMLVGNALGFNGSLVGNVLIKGNKVISEVSQPSNSFAISVVGVDSNFATFFDIDGNNTVFFGSDYNIEWDGVNSGVKGVYLARNNSVYNDGTGSGTGKAWVTTNLNGSTFTKVNNYRQTGATEN